MTEKCVYCLKPVKATDERGLCKGCESCPDSVWRRVLGQLTLTISR